MNMKKKSVDKVVEWLEDQGFVGEVIEAFQGSYISYHTTVS